MAENQQRVGTKCEAFYTRRPNECNCKESVAVAGHLSRRMFVEGDVASVLLSFNRERR